MVRAVGVAFGLAILGQLAAVVVALAAGLGIEDLVALGAGSQLLLTAGGELLVVPLVLAAWVALERRPLRDLGFLGPLSRTAWRLGAGFAIGVGALSLVVGGAWAAGAIHLAAGDVPGALRLHATWLPALAVAAAFEELLLRGYCLQAAGRDRTLVGVAASSAAFAVLHGANPHVLAAGPGLALLTLSNIGLAGALLAAAFLRRRELALPTGLHLGWNWAQALLYGLPVSGLTFDLPSFLEGRPDADAPAWLGGGAFGPEASVFSTLVVGGLAAAGLAWWRRERGGEPSRAPCDNLNEPEGSDL